MEPLSLIVHRDNAYRMGRALVKRLRELIPRQQFKVGSNTVCHGPLDARLPNACQAPAEAVPLQQFATCDTIATTFAARVSMVDLVSFRALMCAAWPLLPARAPHVRHRSMRRDAAHTVRRWAGDCGACICCTGAHPGCHRLAGGRLRAALRCGASPILMYNIKFDPLRGLFIFYLAVHQGAGVMLQHVARRQDLPM